MNIEQLFVILNTYEGFNLNLWNLYIVVILGVLVYAIGSEKVKEWPIRLILAISFLGFALSNLNFIRRNQVLIDAFASEIESNSRAFGEVNNIYVAIADWEKMQPSSLAVFHLVVDGVVIFVILFGPWLERLCLDKPPKV